MHCDDEVTGQDAIVWGGRTIPYTVVYSGRRRSWTIEVKTDGTVVVRMPSSVPPEKVRELVAGKTAWIGTQVEKYTTRVPVMRMYREGEMLPFLGQEYPVIRQTGDTAKAEFSGTAFVITLPAGLTPEEERCISRDMVIFLYRRIGLAPLQEIIARYAPVADVEPPNLRIRLQERKWGCCTPKNGIIVNARVFLAPRIVAEYIVVHELAHLRFRHHQRSFWDEVERLMPDYREAERILKAEGWTFVF